MKWLRSHSRLMAKPRAGLVPLSPVACALLCTSRCGPGKRSWRLSDLMCPSMPANGSTHLPISVESLLRARHHERSYRYKYTL